VRTFHVVFTGDFLDENGSSAYGDMGLSLLKKPHIQIRFLKEQSPGPKDSSYWERFYALEVTAEHIQGVNGLVVLRPWLKRSAFLNGAQDLVVVGRSGAGYDKIDVEALTEHDIALFNAPLALNHATASSALMFMLALAKCLPQQTRIAREGRWDLQAQAMGSELEGRTLGIVGLGHSGRELVRLARPFSMQVLSYSPHADPMEAASLAVRLTTLEEVLRDSDFVSLHCRLTNQTRKMIGKAELSLLKPTAYFINVARGELVDQSALLEALREGNIAGAGLDVFEAEPLPPDDPLTKLENVILTPHWAASTKEVWQKTGQAMAEGMLQAARGQVPDNVVNRDVLERGGFRAKLERFAENGARDKLTP